MIWSTFYWPPNSDLLLSNSLLELIYFISIIWFYDAYFSLYAAHSFKWCAAFFPLHIVSFEIQTFIEIEIYYITGVHQLKYDFYFQLFIKTDFFKFSALVLTLKKLVMSDAYQKFCRGHPLLRCTRLQAFYCLQHFLVIYLLKWYLVSFSRYKLIQTIL